MYHGSAGTLAPPEIIASFLLTFLFRFIFLCIYHFSSLSEVLGFLPFHCVGIEFWETFCFPSWFCNSTFWFSRQLQICTFITPLRERGHCFWFSVARYCLSSIPQGLCITFRSLFSAPCFQIKSNFLS